MMLAVYSALYQVVPWKLNAFKVGKIRNSLLTYCKGTRFE